MLNMGIVKAFGKQDLAGASAAWQQVIATAPDSPEAQAARKALEGLQQAHPGGRTDVRRLSRGAPHLPDRRDGAVRAPRVRAAVRGGVAQGARGRTARPAARSGPAPVKMTQDPVCGTFVVPGKALSPPPAAPPLWFCSEHCRAEFAPPRS